jgi:predicted ABC-type transport system involved in lysophospholipase L1 biosynthesis ATPase subunit
LRNVDLELTVGETLCVLGPSGSGKSTFLQLLAGIDQPTEGEIEWPCLTQPLHPKGIGIAFQAPSLLPPLDVQENVEFPLEIVGVDEATASVLSDQILEQLGLASLSEHMPHELSGGEAQRVVIARALVVRPALVILDEPTGQLDHVTARRVLDVVIKTCEEADAALVIATHDTAVAARMHRTVRLRNGELTEEGFSRPA